MSKNCLRTLVKSEITKESQSEWERGTRCWLSAEIMSPAWFVVEVSMDELITGKTKSWIATNFQVAAQIQKSQEPYKWSNIFVCMRTPHSVRNATVYEVVNQVYALPGSRTLVFQLVSGMALELENASLAPNLGDINEVKLIYSKTRKISPPP
jgi:hypothetical protein